MVATTSRARRGYIEVTIGSAKGWVWRRSVELGGQKQERTEGAAARSDSSLPTRAETAFLQSLEHLERSKTGHREERSSTGWVLRSGHLIFGTPRLVDRRHDFTPDGRDGPVTGISLLVREGFVVAHFDRMRAPLWVAQRWTKFDFGRMHSIPSQGRRWREDLEVPPYARGGTSYDGNSTGLDRGHMARHAMNRAWGVDNSNWGTRMTNSAPQHRDVNRFSSAWQEIEDEVRDIVTSESGIEAVWTVTGTIYRDKTNAADEAPEVDFGHVARVSQGQIGVPYATYKIVAWFDPDGQFRACGYVFEQTYEPVDVDSQQALEFGRLESKPPLRRFLTKIDEIEYLTGLDFFPNLRGDIESSVEGEVPDGAWSDR